jgi:hypothetical protein
MVGRAEELREGAKCSVGSVNSEPGQSLGVHLVGAKAETWPDVAGDEGQVNASEVRHDR